MCNLWDIDSAALLLLVSPGTGAKYCDERVCMCVCLSVCPLTYLKTARLNFSNSSVHVTIWPWLGPPLTTTQEMLCTSDFLDNVIVFT